MCEIGSVPFRNLGPSKGIESTANNVVNTMQIWDRGPFDFSGLRGGVILVGELIAGEQGKRQNARMVI
jgi:hypothetical protein